MVRDGTHGFVELCPYASEQFGLLPHHLTILSADDPGFGTAPRFRDILIEQAKPACMFVNGNAAVLDMELDTGPRLRWDTVSYESPNGLFRGRPKRLWHKQGRYKTDAELVPIVGFPFLRKPSTHNSNAEIADLEQRIRSFLDAVGRETIQP